MQITPKAKEKIIEFLNGCDEDIFVRVVHQSSGGG